ncbi:MAG: hypothetical protein FWG82_01830 [Oscillospiraceae bacterium]|nr:hypothetical protein [Oscillospiraceae bacterium]
MFNDERFGALKERFEQVQQRYSDMAEEKKNAATRTVICKGKLYNVLPFESERNGDKLKGKILTEPIAHNDCHIYHLDGQDRVILIEDISPFSSKPGYFICSYTLYNYNDEYIERIAGSNSTLNRVEWAYLKSGTVNEILCWAKHGCIVNLFDYDDYVLTGIRHFQKPHNGNPESKFDLSFHYDKGNLTLIQRAWVNGRKETIYSTATINFKTLGQRLHTDIEQAITDFLQGHADEQFTRFALDSYMGHGYVSLCFDTRTDDKYWDSPADWAYCDFKSLPLVEFPIDDSQTEKLRKTLLQLAGELSNSEVFKNPIWILLFDHNEDIYDSKK